MKYQRDNADYKSGVVCSVLQIAGMRRKRVSSVDVPAGQLAPALGDLYIFYSLGSKSDPVFSGPTASYPSNNIVEMEPLIFRPRYKLLT